MNYSQKRTLVGRIVYIALTLMAVTILCVTLYTFFGGARVARRPEESTPEATFPAPSGRTETQAPKNDRPTDIPETDDRPVNAEPTQPTDLPGDTDPLPADTPVPKDWTKLKVSMPVEGVVTKKHDLTRAVFSVTMNDYRVHQGIDIECQAGDDVLACAYGTVKTVGNDPFMGRTVVIDHGDGLLSCYRNLADDPASELKPGTVVYAGQVIGIVGESAIIEIAEEPHLHFELELNGKPVDPMTMLDYTEPSAVEVKEDLK